MSQLNFLDTTTQSISWFSKRDADDELSIKPPFQRNPVWSQTQKSFLIDSILLGYPVPELYMQFTTDAEGNDTYIVVDGQQRVRACLEFLEDDYELIGDDLGPWEGSKFTDLTEDQRKKIYNYSFVVRKLPEMNEQQLRAIFGRLNRNTVALNKQELRHATYWGEFITLMEKIADDDRWSDLGIFTANDVRRMLDIEFISELAIAYLHGHQNKKDKLDDWYKAYEADMPRKNEVRTVFNTVLSELIGVFGDNKLGRWSKKSDFYSLFLVLASNKDNLPLARDERQSMKRKLTTFANKVDEYLREDEPEGIGREYMAYANAVEKAASDIANRRKRFEALEVKIL